MGASWPSMTPGSLGAPSSPQLCRELLWICGRSCAGSSCFHRLSVCLPGSLPAGVSWLPFCLLQQPQPLRPLQRPSPQTHSFFKTSILFLPMRAVLWSPPPSSAAGQAQVFSSPGPALTPGAGSASSFRWGQLHLFLDLRGQTSPRVRCSACSWGSINEGWHHCRTP